MLAAPKIGVCDSHSTKLNLKTVRLLELVTRGISKESKRRVGLSHRRRVYIYRPSEHEQPLKVKYQLLALHHSDEYMIELAGYRC